MSEPRSQVPRIIAYVGILVGVAAVASVVLLTADDSVKWWMLGAVGLVAALGLLLWPLHNRRR